MTLTQTAIVTKRLLIAGVLTLILGFMIWGGFIYYQATRPKPTAQLPIPTVKFGILPRPLLPEASASASNYNFSLDTETGELPTDTPPLVNVYVSPQLGATLLAADRVKDLARKMGFDQGPIIVNANQHRFTNAFGGQVTINLDTGNFVLENPESSPSAQQIARQIDDETTIASTFKSYLSSKGLLKPSLGGGKIEVKYDGASRSESTRALISLWPTKLNELDIVTPTYTSGLINAVYSKYGRDDLAFLQFNYTYWEADESSYSTYTIKSPAQAFDDLKNNRGVIVVKPSSSRASITSVRLAYYEPNEYPTYIQPIYVFEGPSFAAYVPAITDDYLAKD